MFNVFWILIALVVLIVGVTALGEWRWRSDIARLYNSMISASGAAEAQKTVDFKQLVGLPRPVQRYFRIVLNDGQAKISSVRVEQFGFFDMGLGSGASPKESWKPFRATQDVSTWRLGFIWDARIHIAPGIAAHVCDAYVAGEGILFARLLGFFKVAEFRGTPEAAEGELMRFFAEAAWYPTMLLPGEHVHWEGIDERSAKATFTDGACTFTGDFHFDDQGLIESIKMDRLRLVSGDTVRTPWIGRFDQYEQHSGMVVPVRGEVFWELPDGLRSYWRGRLSNLRYEFAG